MKAIKDFDLLVDSGDGHGAGRRYGQCKLMDFFVRNLPDEQTLRGTQSKKGALEMPRRKVNNRSIARNFPEMKRCRCAIN